MDACELQEDLLKSEGAPCWKCMNMEGAVSLFDKLSFKIMF